MKVVDGVLSESALLALAGPTIAARIESLVPSVQGLRVGAGRADASVQGRRVYVVELTWGSSGIEGACTCRDAAGGSFCKHLVAVGLAVIDGAEGEGPSAEATSVVDRFLDTLGADDLRDLVRQLADTSEAGLHTLEVRAALAMGDGGAVGDELVAHVRTALDFRGFVDYRRSFEVARDAGQVLDELQTHLDAGAADAVRPALLKALTRLRTITEHADDSSGSIGGECQRAADLYARSCRDGSPDAVKVAKWLVKFRDTSPGWPDLVLADFAPVFDAKALKAFRAGVAALEQRDAGKDGFGRFELDRMLLELADHDGDVDRAVELLRAGGHPRYQGIVTRLLAADRRAEALAVVDEAVAAAHSVDVGGRGEYALDAEWVARLYLDESRVDDALAVVRGPFVRGPGVATYELLGRIADEVGRGAAERSWAWESAEAGARRVSDGSVLVELALHEGDLERAWAAADAYGPGRRWQELAAASESAVPDRALQLYWERLDALLGPADQRAYRTVAAHLAVMRRLAAAAGTPDLVDAEIHRIRDEYRRRPSMMTILDKQGLPR